MEDRTWRFIYYIIVGERPPSDTSYFDRNKTPRFKPPDKSKFWKYEPWVEFFLKIAVEERDRKNEITLEDMRGMMTLP